MKLTELKKHLQSMSGITLVEPNGNMVPEHFHITEAGLVTKHFIDCGGSIHEEQVITFQVWVANDIEHRLTPEKLLRIIAQSEPLFKNNDLEIEIEYQGDTTIGKFGLKQQDNHFILTRKQTQCLAEDHCGIPQEKRKVALSELQTTAACCTPSKGGCC